jgi:hypothetical protein
VLVKTLDEMAKFLASHDIRLGIASRQVAGGLHVYQATLTEADGRPLGLGQDADLAKAVEAAIQDAGGYGSGDAGSGS